MLTADQAVEQAKVLTVFRAAEREGLDEVRRYWKGRQTLPGVIPTAAPSEVRRMAEMARVNVCRIVIDSMAQSMFVDGFRGKEETEDAEVWNYWQANKMDARQTGIHRATFAYGAAYAVVLPGDPTPVIKGVSPRNMTAVYGEDPNWPMFALEKLGHGLWRLFDDEGVYYLSGGISGTSHTFLEAREHNLEVTPVVRFLDEDDLDAWDDVEPDNGRRHDRRSMVGGQIAPLFPIQDQVDFTTFGLLVAQHYSAFRQRWILGWTAESEKEKMKAAASQMWTFEDHPDDVKIGEFEQTSLDGYIQSREASLRHAATLSQTPVHELIGELVNLSAEALVAAENGRDRKIAERQALAGESHEQTMWLCGQAGGIDVPNDAQVVWRDTSARAFNTTVEALGNLVEKLHIPPQELWERVPGVTRQEIERWKKAAAEGDSFAMFRDLLERQGAPAPTPAGA